MKKAPLIMELTVGLLIAIIIGVGWRYSNAINQSEQTKDTTAMASQDTSETIEVYVYNEKGEWVGPVRSSLVIRSDEQWEQTLTGEQYRILRKAGTERAGTGALLHNKETGVYSCAGCGLPLYKSDAKFNSGTGWPSFFQPIASGNVAENRDERGGMVRTEIHCARCGGHLGHVFNDGPKPTGLRHCLNSGSLRFTSSDHLATLADPAATLPQRKAVVLAGGCFWCTEAVFEPVRGVIEVVSGYAGGREDNATYREVSAGNTQHAEAIRITYDPSQVRYEKLLELFFNVAHDPTQLNRQGNDVGTQYRSAVFVDSDEQRAVVQNYINQLNETGQFAKPIVTTIEPLTVFYSAEQYHQDYAELHPDDRYIRAVAQPKVDKLEKKYGDLLKADD